MPFEVMSSLLAFFFAAALVYIPFYTAITGYKLYRAKKNHDRPLVRKYKPLFKDKRLKSFLAI